MKLFFIVLCVALFSGCGGSHNGPKGADSPDHLLMLAKKYHTTKDVKNMLRLYKTAGVSGNVVKSKEKWIKKVFEYGFKDIKVEVLPEGACKFFNTPLSAGGQTVSHNLYVDSQLTAIYNGNRQEGFLFGQNEEDGRYYFALQVSG